jgi:hypothetical protein
MKRCARQNGQVASRSQKVQIINLNRVLMIICRGTNDTNTHLFTSIFRDKLSLQGARISLTINFGTHD